MKDSYGMDLNFSLVSNGENDYQLGMRFTDSEGTDVSSDVTTDDLSEGVNAIITEIMTGVTDQKKKAIKEEEQKGRDLQEYISELEGQIESLKIDNQVLENRVQTLMGDASKKEEKKPAKACPKKNKSRAEHDELIDLLRLFDRSFF